MRALVISPSVALLAAHAAYAQTTCRGLTYATDFQNDIADWQSTMSAGNTSTINPSHASVGPSGLTLNAGPGYGSWLENANFWQTYGVFQATVNVSQGMLAPGMTSAVWLLAKNIPPGSAQNWPAEIDYWESIGPVDDVAMHSGFTPDNAGAWYYNIAPGEHTVTVDWEPDKITWYLDKQQFQQRPTPPDFNQPMHFILDAMNQGGSASGSMTVTRLRAFDNMQDMDACDSAPVAFTPNTTSPSVQQGQNAVQTATNLSVDDVAKLALQGMTADGQSTIDTIAAAATSQITQAVASLARGDTMLAQPTVLSFDAPSGTMPPPPAATTSVSIDASGTNQTVTEPSGNGSGTVSGTGNSVMAIGGTQRLDITGIGNTVITGPYDDSVTVEATGNTIDLGGGTNTITLAYKPKPATDLMAVSPQQIDQDAPGIAPLTPTGNIFVAPQPGMGVVTIQGTPMDSKDVVDLTQSLAGVAGWDHKASDISQFVTVSGGMTGTEISVQGRTVVVLASGVARGNPLQYLVAR